MIFLGLTMAMTVIFISGIRKVKHNHHGLIERFGKYRRIVKPGYHWISPLIEKLFIVNAEEQIADTEYIEILTYDKHFAYLNAKVYFKVKADEKSIKRMFYDVNNYNRQLINLTRSSLRNIINTLPNRSIITETGHIGNELHNTLARETNYWGIEILDIKLNKKIPNINLWERNHNSRIYDNSFASNLN
jgi:regulator of protease activity HflC (stomatin/prohibitin superfamily)